MKTLVIISIGAAVLLTLLPRKYGMSTALANPPCSRYSIQPFTSVACQRNGAALAPNVEVAYNDGDTFKGTVTSGCATWPFENAAFLRSYIFNPANSTWAQCGVYTIQIEPGYVVVVETLHGSANPNCTSASCGTTPVYAEQCGGGY